MGRKGKMEKSLKKWDFLVSKSSERNIPEKFLSLIEFKCPVDLNEEEKMFYINSNGNYLLSSIRKNEKALISTNKHMKLFNIGGKIKSKKKRKTNKRRREKKNTLNEK